MSEDAAIRRQRLRSLKLSAKDLQAKAGKSPSYWRDLLGLESKSFGEKAARYIEDKLELPPRWLDGIEHTTALPAAGRSTAHTLVVQATHATPTQIADALLSAPEAVREELAQVLAQLVKTGSSAYCQRLAELLAAPADTVADLQPLPDIPAEPADFADMPAPLRGTLIRADGGPMRPKLPPRIFQDGGPMPPKLPPRVIQDGVILSSEPAAPLQKVNK